MKECLIDSRFYFEKQNQSESFFKTPLIYLLRNGDNYLTNETGEFPSVCPDTFFNTYPYDATFIVEPTGDFDADRNPFIVGNRVRFKNNGVWYIEQLSPLEYDEEIDFPLSSETYAQLESNLLYSGIVFDDSQPDDSNGGFVYWWDTSTETLYYLQDAITPIEVDLSEKVSRTQEEIEADSTDVDLVDPKGSVLKRYNPHNITKLDLTEDKPETRAEYTHFWTQVDSKILYGRVPREYRRLSIETPPSVGTPPLEFPNVPTNASLPEPCTDFQFNNPDFERYEYEQKDNPFCTSNLGLNPCYERFRFKCV